MRQTNKVVPKEHHIHEECGVFGVFSEGCTDVASLAYYGLYALQHRGQESAGIVVNDDGKFSMYRDEGLVNEVFPTERLQALGQGNIVVGHVRYATTGSDRKRNAQPIVINHHKGRMALAHNGNLTNSYELRNTLEQGGSIFHTTTDSEVIAYIIVQERLRCPSIEEAVYAAMGRIEGAYSLVISSSTKLIAARDPHGFRPLCMGKTEDGKVVFASESCALDAVGAGSVRDVRPGEIITVSGGGIRSDDRRCGSAPAFVAPCYYGTDIDDAEDLIANHHSVDEIAKMIGVDSLGYLSIDHLIQTADGCGAFCTACFGGEYPTAIPSHGEKDRFERKLKHKVRTEEELL